MNTMSLLLFSISSPRFFCWSALPALALGQYRIWRRQAAGGVVPVAFASWAGLSPDAEERPRAVGPRLDKDAWTGGETLWLMVAPSEQAPSTFTKTGFHSG